MEPELGVQSGLATYETRSDILAVLRSLPGGPLPAPYLLPLLH
jgi:hypothetical protein